MPTPTYDLISSTTLAASSSEVLFGSIPQGYRDLVLVANGTGSASGGLLWFNGDLTGANYPSVVMYSDGNTPMSGVQNTLFFSVYGFESRQASIVHIFDYSQADKHKTVLIRANQAGTNVGAYATRWANTAAINSILARIITGTFDAGTTFSLYGIAG